MKLHLAPDLTLPVDVVTQTIAVLAKRRAGKSYTMRRLVEQLFTAGQQVVLVDPKGDQWGVRSSADGKGPGLAIVILGGERGDVPLEVGAGEIVAKLVVEERVSVLLDLSLFRKREVATFMADFLEHLYRLKAREIYRTPVMLVVDEADAIAPQKPQPGEERMLGAIEDIVRRGGQRGIGCTVVTQRSAVLNKNVLTQAQILVALRTIAPQDLKAMKEWIDVHGEEAQRRTLMESLPSLPIGDAWFWSPGWPTERGIFARVHVSPIETFDSGATPKPGEKRHEPKSAADVDLEALKRQMAATIEKAKADDPRELRKQITELKKQAATQPSVAAKQQKVAREQPVLTDADRQLLEKLAAAIAARTTKATDLVDHELSRLDDRIKSAVAEYLNVTRSVAVEMAAELEKTLQRVTVQKLLGKLASVEQSRNYSESIPKPQKSLSPQEFGARFEAAGRAEPRRQVTASASDSTLGKGERIVLTAVAQYPAGVTREQLTVLTGYKRSSRDTYLQRLTQNGFVLGNGCRLVATESGVAALGDFDRLPTGDARRAYLEILSRHYPASVDRDRLSDATGYKRSSRDTYFNASARGN